MSTAECPLCQLLLHNIRETLQMDAMIVGWLQDIPALPREEEEKGEEEEEEEEGQHRQRQKQRAQHSRKRRLPLGEMSQNVSTPAKRARKTKDTNDAVLVQEDNPSEATPRPLEHIQLRSPGPSARHNYSTSFSYAHTSQSSHATTTESQTSLKRKRSISPSKGLAQLTRLQYPVHQETIDLPNQMPEPLRALTRTVRGIEKGKGIIPEDDRTDELRKSLADEEDEDDWAGVVSSARTEYGSIPDMKFTQYIIAATAQNIRLGRSEAAWNCNVHYPLLAEACTRSVASQHIRIENITTASIIDSATNTTRRADFAITFAIPDATVAALSDHSIDTLCHSSYQPLCYSPPAVSIETKLEGSHGQEAGLQLSIWAHAHAMTLKALLYKAGRPDAQIPALPLLVVQGSKWYFNYFEIRPEKAVRWSQVHVGDTGTVRGVYQVVAALQRLVEWTATMYRQWFLENIVEPLVRLPAEGSVWA